MSLNDLDYEKRVKNILSFENDNQKIDFETEIIHIEIINQIISIMEERKISKSDLARILGTSKSYITQLFSGDKILNLKLLAKLQRIFNIKFKISYKNLEINNNKFTIILSSKGNLELEGKERNEIIDNNKIINFNDYRSLDKLVK